MKYRINVFAALVAGILGTSATGALAQVYSYGPLVSTARNDVVSKSYSRSAGNSWLGLTGYAYGYMRSYVADTSQYVYTGWPMTLASANARGYLRATANILKSTKEMVRFDVRGNAYSRTNGVTTSGSYRLRLAGKVMEVSDSFTKSTSFPRFSKYISLFPVDPRADIQVGPLTLTVKGNAGVGVSSSGYVLLLPNPTVGLGYTAKAWGQGKASVSVGILGFAAGVEAEARLAEQTLAVTMSANKSGIKGRLDYYIQALRLKLRVFAHALWGVWRRLKYSNTVLDRTWGSYHKVLFNI